MRAAKYFVMVMALCAALPSLAQVPYERLMNSDAEPQNWLMYGGNYGSQRFSGLKEITPQNATNLRVAWVYQMRGGGVMESSPLIVDGIMYVTEPPSNVTALDARTGKPLWHYVPQVPRDFVPVGLFPTNRGVAILGDKLYLATIDDHLIALDAKSGVVRWNSLVADKADGYAMREDLDPFGPERQARLAHPVGAPGRHGAQLVAAPGVRLEHPAGTGRLPGHGNLRHRAIDDGHRRAGLDPERHLVHRGRHGGDDLDVLALETARRGRGDGRVQGLRPGCRGGPRRARPGRARRAAAGRRAWSGPPRRATATPIVASLRSLGAACQVAGTGARAMPPWPGPERGPRCARRPRTAPWLGSRRAAAGIGGSRCAAGGPSVTGWPWAPARR